MNDLLEGMIAYAREHNCSDIHLNVGGPAMIRQMACCGNIPHSSRIHRRQR